MLSRNVIVTVGVIVFHVLGLWLLQIGLLRRAVELIVPAQMIAEFIEPPRPMDEPTRPPPTERTAPTKPPKAVPAPQLIATADRTLSPDAPVGVFEPPVQLPPLTVPVFPSPPAAAARLPAPSAPPSSPAPPAPPRMELPSTDADYLQNPRPPYPPMSKKLNEQGGVMMRVLIGADGLAQKAEIRTSSGYDRLDQSAAATVMKWRYVPGKRAGVAEAMWFNVPIHFVLE